MALTRRHISFHDGEWRRARVGLGVHATCAVYATSHIPQARCNVGTGSDRARCRAHWIVGFAVCFLLECSAVV